MTVTTSGKAEASLAESDDSGNQPIPPELWGKDHWSTFAYVANRILDYKGVPNLTHMRSDPNLHPGLPNISPMGNVLDGAKYPTRLKDGREVTNHDDWSCVEDMEAAGLVEWRGTGISPVFKFTDSGYEVWAKLYRHKAEGNSFGSFVLKGDK